MKHEHVWERLVESTIKIGARDGIEKVTTRKIAAGAGLAEAYIYQHCKDKTELLEETFMEIRSRIGRTLEYAASRIDPKTAHVDYIARILWCAYWNYLLENEEELRFFLNFHHSGYYTEQMAHRWPESFMTFGRLMVELDKIYNVSASTNVPVMIIHIETGTMDLALAYLRGQIPQTQETVETVYRAIMKPLLDDVCMCVDNSEKT